MTSRIGCKPTKESLQPVSQTLGECQDTPMQVRQRETAYEAAQAEVRGSYLHLPAYSPPLAAAPATTAASVDLYF